MSKGNNSHTVTLTSPEGEVKEVKIDFSWSYDPGVHTYPNGDPGYPSSCEIDIDSITTTDGSEVPSWVTDDICFEELDKINIDFWEDNEYPGEEDDFVPPFNEKYGK